MQALPDRSSKTTTYFCQLLFYATLVPFCIGLLSLLCANLYTSPPQYLDPIRSAILFMATIHVPLTIYLFCDEAIRERIKSDSLKFIVIPSLILLGSIAIFTGNVKAKSDHNATILTCFAVGILAWNLWHFGKQNIGVYSYYRLGKSGRMLLAEKRMIYLGAILGAFSAIVLKFKDYIGQYSEYGKFASMMELLPYAAGGAQYVQYALSAVSLLYVVRHYARFDVKTAMVFLICVNFFLPAYLSIDYKPWASVFSIGSLSHGLQYVTFLLFHSFYRKNAARPTLKIRGMPSPS